MQSVLFCSVSEAYIYACIGGIQGCNHSYNIHWLPVRKTVMLETWCWRGSALTALLTATSPNSAVRSCCHCFRSSASQVSLNGPIQVTRVRTMIGRRSFAVAEPSLWNSLPAALWRPEMTLHTFKRQLKAYLFGDCSTSDVLANRMNIHHRPALLWRFRDSGAGYIQVAQLSQRNRAAG